MGKWQEVSTDPMRHPEFDIIVKMGMDGATIKEFGRLAAERCAANRIALLNVGRDLGFSESELFQAEEMAAEAS